MCAEQINDISIFAGCGESTRSRAFRLSPSFCRELFRLVDYIQEEVAAENLQGPEESKFMTKASSLRAFSLDLVLAHYTVTFFLNSFNASRFPGV